MIQTPTALNLESANCSVDNVKQPTASGPRTRKGGYTLGINRSNGLNAIPRFSDGKFLDFFERARTVSARALGWAFLHDDANVRLPIRRGRAEI
jgi:hypothetical protein